MFNLNDRNTKLKIAVNTQNVAILKKKSNSLNFGATSDSGMYDKEGVVLQEAPDRHNPLEIVDNL